MASVKVQAKLSTDDLLKAVDQLDKRNLESFLQKILVLVAGRKAPSLPQNEAELLKKINQIFPQEIQQRYSSLIARRNSETLTDAEHAELLKLTDQVENLERRRIEYLAELAQLRRTTLNQVMQQLGIQPPNYD